MRIVLVAYDFPPIPSPQSLRWAYLVRELALQGHEIHVLTPDLPGYGAGGLPQLPETVAVHRVYPGPLSALLRGGRKAPAKAAVPVPSPASSAPSVAPVPSLEPVLPPSWTHAAVPGTVPSMSEPARNVHSFEEPDWNGRFGNEAHTGLQSSPASKPAGIAVPAGNGHAYHDLNWKGRLRHRVENGFRSAPATLNWKGRLVERLKRGLSRVIFPDYRAEWLPWARRDLRSLLDKVRPDLVVTSHEPACSLPLGLEAKRLGYRWVADLGDPVLATYTPEHWKERAHQLERNVCHQADMVCVTTEKTALLLEQRHGRTPARRLVLTQGYDAAFVDREELAAAVPFDGRRLELLYTGSFYAFRRADALIAAVEAVPGVRLSVATINAPDYLLEAVARHPEKFRLLGFLSHTVALSAQRRCDVLVNIANADPVQIPGKVYEYLGAGRPMIHLRGATVDATSELIDATGGGWHMPTGSEDLNDLLRQLKVRKDSGQLPMGIKEPDQVVSHSWQQLARLWGTEASCLLDDAS